MKSYENFAPLAFNIGFSTVSNFLLNTGNGFWCPNGSSLFRFAFETDPVLRYFKIIFVCYAQIILNALIYFKWWDNGIFNFFLVKIVVTDIADSGADVAMLSRYYSANVES